MEQYLGICMVIVVTALCVAVLSRIVTGSILGEFESVKRKRTERKLNAFQKAMKILMDAVGPTLKDIMKEGDANKVAKKGFKDGAKYAENNPDKAEEFSEAIDELLK